MRRTKAIAISREGINHVRSIVERCNSAFQEISQHNDLGNDAYVEFIHDEQATSFCVALQVKTGKSFLRRNSALIIADREHFEYWRNHILPIAGTRSRSRTRIVLLDEHYSVSSRASEER